MHLAFSFHIYFNYNNPSYKKDETMPYLKNGARNDVVLIMRMDHGVNLWQLLRGSDMVKETK